jgi:uridine kinase
MVDINTTVERIFARRSRVPAQESMLVALSGIDASGKGYLTERIVAALQENDMSAININMDGWLNLPSRRFNREHPAEHFYHHAVRFEEMFDQLILPLKKERSICVEADLVQETSIDYYRHTYNYQDVDVIILEGIFLLKQAFQKFYDLSIWVECSFETALERALQRGQEGLPLAETIWAYENIYFPAQRIHFSLDDPRMAADEILINDPRLEMERLSHPDEAILDGSVSRWPE